MGKSNKELAVDIAIEYIRAHQKQIVAASNNTIKETTMISLESVSNTIKSVCITLDGIDKSSNQ